MDALVACHVTGTPTPTVYWMHNHTIIDAGDKHSLQEGGLLVRAVTQDDEGEYECMAEVAEHGMIDTARIEVHVVMDSTPRIISLQGEMIKTEGEDVLVDCVSVVGDVSSLRWLDVEGNPVDNSSDRMMTTTNGVRRRLEIRGLREQDAGVYTCDQAGLQTSLQVSIYKDISIETEPTQYLLTSTDSLIKCRVTANPSATITWRLNGLLIHTNTSKYMIQEDGLLVKAVTRDDEGAYECRAEVQSTGSFRMASIQVHVLSST